MTTPTWKPIVGSNDLIISQDGRVGRLTRGSLDGDGLDVEVRELSCERGHDRLRRIRVRIDDDTKGMSQLRRLTVRELVGTAWLLEDRERGRLPPGWKVRLRDGVIDPIGLDEAGILTVVDSRGREQVGAAGKEIQRAWDRERWRVMSAILSGEE